MVLEMVQEGQDGKMLQEGHSSSVDAGGRVLTVHVCVCMRSVHAVIFTGGLLPVLCSHGLQCWMAQLCSGMEGCVVILLRLFERSWCWECVNTTCQTAQHMVGAWYQSECGWVVGQ